MLPTAEELASRIRGIEIDPANAEASRAAMTEAAMAMGVEGPFAWDIACGDALELSVARRSSFDYVVGNPPYVSHRLVDERQRRSMRGYSMCAEGAPDLYIAFFAAGLLVLRRGGTLCYITPSTYMHISGGAALRRRLRMLRECAVIVDVNRYDAFSDAQTSAVVTRLDKDVAHDAVRVGTWSKDGMSDLSVRPYGRLFVGDVMSLVADEGRRRRFAAVMAVDPSRYRGRMEAWGGLSTGLDRAFIDERDGDLEEGPYVRRAYKARKGVWSLCVCPYGPDGGLVPFEALPEAARRRLSFYEEGLRARSSRGEWYAWASDSELGRSRTARVAVSNLVTDLSSVRACEVPAGCLVYGSPSVPVSERHPAEEILAALRSQDFVDYVHDLHKIKGEGPTADGRGTKYEFTVGDLARYLCYVLEGGNL